MGKLGGYQQKRCTYSGYNSYLDLSATDGKINIKAQVRAR